MLRWLVNALFALAALLLLLTGFARAYVFFYAQMQRKFGIARHAELSNREKRRLQHYFYGVSYLSIIFSTLRGQFRSRTEKHRFVHMSALAAFFDDLSDQIQSFDFLPDNPESYAAAADERGIAQQWLQTVQSSLATTAVPDFRRHLQSVFTLETRARQRDNQPPSVDELISITAEKGGQSVLLFRSLLNQAAGEGEIAALRQFGALIQLCDDIFDLWHDRRDGISTLPTLFAASGQLPALEAYFESEAALTRQLFLSLRGLKSRIAWAEVNYIVNITRVCLQHYRELAKKRGTLPLDERQAMVVDMENPSQRLRVASMLLKHPG